MTEKELAKKLKQLQRIEADSKWKKEFRNVLWQKVSSEKFNYADLASSKEKFYSRFFEFCKKLNPKKIKQVPQPAFMVGAVVLLILAGGVVTVNATDNAKPDSPFYFARIIKEKARLAATFNEDKKTKMGIKFASNHAKDISEVLSGPEYRGDQNPEEKKKLSRDFKENINSVKMQLEEMKATEEKDDQDKKDREQQKQNNRQKEPKQDVDATQVSEEQDGNSSGEKDSNKEQASEENSQEGEKFSIVDSAQKDRGVEIYDSPEEEQQQEENVSDDLETTSTEKGTTSGETTSTTTRATSSLDNDVSEKLKSAEKIMSSEDHDGDKLSELITRAEKLFKQGEYEKVRETLDEFMSVIESQDSQTQDNQDDSESAGEVKGVSEEATSTQEGGETASTTASTTQQN